MKMCVCVDMHIVSIHIYIYIYISIGVSNMVLGAYAGVNEIGLYDVNMCICISTKPIGKKRIRQKKFTIFFGFRKKEIIYK